MGGEVHMDIYDDRIVLTSPGGMYSGQMVQDVPIEDISSNRRNPVLADVMAQLDYMEKRGSGLKRICNETKALKTYKEGREPVFKSSVAQFMTVIYSMEYDITQEKGKDPVNGPVNDPVNTLPLIAQKVYSIIKDNEGIRRPGIMQELGVSDSTIKRNVALLMEMKLIEHRGAAKTGGYFVKHNLNDNKNDNENK